ncbi:mu-type opioid receptor-like isoform X2 [Symsagittifera roscoffensis]
MADLMRTGLNESNHVDGNSSDGLIDSVGDLGALFALYSEEMGVIENVQSVINPLLALFSMLINLYIARLVVRDNSLHKFTYIMVAYQAILDSVFVCPLKIYLELNQKLLKIHSQDVVCTLTALYNGITITTTAPVLLFLCIERFLLVVHPVNGKIWLDNWGTKLFFALNMGTSGIYTVWLIAGSYSEGQECIMTFRLVSVTVTGLMFFLIFYCIPLLFMTTLYPTIAFRLMNSPSQRNYNANKRISKLLGVSTITFAVLWAPLMWNSVWIIAHESSWVSLMTHVPILFYIYGFSIVFISLYSAVNPCIYIMLTRPIREPIVSRVSRGKEELKQLPLLRKSPSNSNTNHPERQAPVDIPGNTNINDNMNSKSNNNNNTLNITADKNDVTCCNDKNKLSPKLVSTNKTDNRNQLSPMRSGGENEKSVSFA